MSRLTRTLKRSKDIQTLGKLAFVPGYWLLCYWPFTSGWEIKVCVVRDESIFGAAAGEAVLNTELYFVSCWNTYPCMYITCNISFNFRGVRTNLLQLIIHKWLASVVNLTQAWEVVITYTISLNNIKYKNIFPIHTTCPVWLVPQLQHLVVGCLQLLSFVKPRFPFEGRLLGFFFPLYIYIKVKNLKTFIKSKS